MAPRQSANYRVKFLKLAQFFFVFHKIPLNYFAVMSLSTYRLRFAAIYDPLTLKCVDVGRGA